LSSTTPRVALLTPVGRGGVAVVALVGAGAGAVLERAFRGKRGLPASGRIALGELVQGTAVVDEVLLARVESAAAGDEDRFELGCHGGPGVARQVVAALVAAGAREVAARELDAPASDATVREARAILPSVATELAARVLAHAAAGALGKRVGELEAEVAAGDLQKIQGELAALEATARFGLACAEPPAVALLGRPNAGKSSLLNALAGRERAIVSPEPGTTRDVLEETVALAGLPVRLLDLAGVRASEDAVERAGVARGLERAGQAALRLLLVDASEPLAPAVGELAASAPLVLVLTKRDLVAPEKLAPLAEKIARDLGRELETVAVSALRGEGLDELARAIVRALVGATDLEALAREPALFTERQLERVRGARAALARGDRDAAAREMKGLLDPTETRGASRARDD